MNPKNTDLLFMDFVYCKIINQSANIVIIRKIFIKKYLLFWDMINQMKKYLIFVIILIKHIEKKLMNELMYNIYPNDLHTYKYKK